MYSLSQKSHCLAHGRTNSLTVGVFSDADERSQWHEMVGELGVRSLNESFSSEPSPFFVPFV